MSRQNFTQPEIQKSSLKNFISKISQILGNLKALEASAELFIDECLFSMPKDCQKCIQLTKHPNFRKKYVEPGVEILI